jgi:16S rRNA (cytidine1402-2'-O)-methyltransferase
MLYLVPTPLGNLEDITMRAIKILQTVDIILAEDTRTSSVLLKHFKIQTQLQAFHAFNEHKSLQHILKILAEGKQIALITDAGTPGISDPGFLLVRACVEQNIKVSCLPGPVAFIPALVTSGIPCDRFYFEGFLPHKKGRQTRWQYLSKMDCTFVLYESPFRLIKCIEEVITYCGAQRKMSISREISKIFEETITMNAIDMLTHFKSKPPKGEIVVVVSGNDD